MTNLLKTDSLMAGFTLVLLIAGQVPGGQSGMVMALLLALGMNFSSYSYWYSDKMVLEMMQGRGS